MTDLPPGWATTTLGEIAETMLGKMLDRKKHTGEHAVPYLRNINVQWGRIDLDDVLTMEIPPEQQPLYELRSGDLLICEGGEIGRCAVWHGSSEYMAFQKALHRVRPLGGIDPRYLRYLIEHIGVSGKLARFATGSTIKHLPQEQLRRIPILLPPVAEQKRIVSILENHLSRCEAAASLLHGVMKRIDRLRDRVMEAASLGRLSELNSETYATPPAPAGVLDGDLPCIPADWRWVRLGDIAEVVGGVTRDSKKQSDPEIPEVPYLRVANVQRARLDLSNISYIRVSDVKAKQLLLRRGDVLLNEGGDRDKLGRGWIWEDQIPGCIHQNHVFRARLREDVLHPKLLAWHANGFGRSWFDRNGKQSVNLASISLSKIKLFPVPIPPPALQGELVAEAERHLSTLDDAETAVRKALLQAGYLRRSLLSEACSGGLTSQTAEDEPASVLLQRIKVERAASQGGRAGKLKSSAGEERQEISDVTLDVISNTNLTNADSTFVQEALL
ncbi:restriction endonuclease subunit S [Nonomuraea sp. MCN248]|uniref:Restriction endonuclease subunit S n=1 Tax=Nonomuraea corallina TaxID=2989783 RepID=A0ABT4S5Q8_9ACTN|nr:restriction endonuclease subunit S [Nonomuraea corallina]MDA0632533.1 restriction endonuclease subunit S [Nonomuraea corallina]